MEKEKVKLANAFSLQMLPAKPAVQNLEILKIEDISYIKKQIANDAIEIESFIGHADTAKILSNMLGIEVQVNRAAFQIEKGERILVAQFVGGRLPEGATTLPENVKIVFYEVSLM